MLRIAIDMMGHWQKQTELWVEPVHLGRRIPKDHLLRKISKALDLSFVRAEVALFYGSNGNVSLDPVNIVANSVRRYSQLDCFGSTQD